jgi:putative lipoic acid-binding regulatory protein
MQVNKYPSQRVFTAIGTGGDDFKEKMLKAVEAVVGTVHMECVSERPSSGGKYVSVRIGPVWVETADQVRRELL